LNQIKRIIHSTMGKAFVLCAFALTLLGGTSAAFYSRESGSAENLKSQLNSLTFTQINCQEPFFTGALASLASGINNNGQIVGTFIDNMGNGHGFLYEQQGCTKLDYPYATFTAAWGINDSGQIVGEYTDSQGGIHGFLWDDGDYTEVEFPIPEINFLAKGINNSGQIVGHWARTDNIIRSYLLEGTAITYFEFPDAPPRIVVPGDGSPPIGINGLGQIVGEFKDNYGVIHGYIRSSNGEFTQIDVKFPNVADTLASGINDLGQIVGGFTDADDRESHGFLKTGTNFTKIDVQIDEQAVINTIVFGINNGGQMVGWYTTINDGILHGFLASP
jgi:probable HAF family extracellular repeat protein